MRSIDVQDWKTDTLTNKMLKTSLPSSTRNTNVPRIGLAAVTSASHSTVTMKNTMSERPEHALHDYAAPTYGSRQQFATIDTFPAVDSKDTKRI
jgi:hypothetical protein